MDKYIPNMYKNNILDINYSKLRDIGIKCLIFDLDNTIASLDEDYIPKKVLSLFETLQKDFQLVVISNNFQKRIEPFCKPLNIPFVSFAMKPLPFGFKKIKDQFNYEQSQMCMIGDQLMTDILGGNSFGIFTILVDPLSKKDLKVTTINRFLEDTKIKKLTKMNILRRGKYYE